MVALLCYNYLKFNKIQSVLSYPNTSISLPGTISKFLLNNDLKKKKKKKKKKLNSLFCLHRTDLYQKLLNTKDHIDRTTVEGSAIRDTSVSAKNVLHKAEEIHENVDSELLKAVVTFKVRVDEHRSNLDLETEPEIIAISPEVAEFGTQTISTPPVLMASQMTQMKHETTDQSTQTSLMYDNVIQQEKDFWVVLSDESDEDIHLPEAPLLDQKSLGFVSQVVGGVKSAKNRIGEAF